MLRPDGANGKLLDAIQESAAIVTESHSRAGFVAKRTPLSTKRSVKPGGRNIQPTDTTALFSATLPSRTTDSVSVASHTARYTRDLRDAGLV
jgi:hypothetical protein